MRATTGLKTLQEALQHMQQHSPHRDKLEAAAWVCAWKAIMPDIVTKRTSLVFYTQGKLFVKLNSSTLRQALRLNKDKIVSQLQKQAPEAKSLDVVLL